MVLFSGEWELDYDPKGGGGSRVLEDPILEDSSAVYQKRGTAQWTFQPADLCQDLAEAIHHDLAYAKAYQDPATRRQPIHRYKCYVDPFAYHDLKGRWPTEPELRCDQDLPKGGEAAGVGDEIGVDKDCKVVNAGTYKDKARRSCTPEELIQAVLVHENVHVEQRRRQPALYNSGDTEYWGDTEVRAHLAGIAAMLDSLKRYCPQYHTGDIESRIRELDRNRLKH